MFFDIILTLCLEGFTLLFSNDRIDATYIKQANLIYLTCKKHRITIV